MVVVEGLITNRALDAVRTMARLAPVRAAYLFGSQITGTAGQWSDIDIAVFVEGAEGWDFHRLSRSCAAAQRAVGRDIEMHVFPASSYDNPPRASFAQYILKHGLPLEIESIPQQFPSLLSAQ